MPLDFKLFTGRQLLTGLDPARERRFAKQFARIPGPPALRLLRFHYRAFVRFDDDGLLLAAQGHACGKFGVHLGR